MRFIKIILVKLFVWLFISRLKKDVDFYGYLLDLLQKDEKSMYISKFKSQYEYDIEINRELQEQLKKLLCEK